MWRRKDLYTPSSHQRRPFHDVPQEMELQRVNPCINSPSRAARHAHHSLSGCLLSPWYSYHYADSSR